MDPNIPMIGITILNDFKWNARQLNSVVPIGN
jgi:hypothetical protein